MDFNIIEFCEASHGSLINELTEILHDAYRPLAEQGMRYMATHQPPDITLRRLKKGISFFGFSKNELIATITLIKSDPTEPCNWYQKSEVYYFSQFAVKTNHQGLGFGKALLNFIEKYAYQNGAQELALDTSEHADELISMYKKRSYRFVEYANWDSTNYRSVILSKSLGE